MAAEAATPKIVWTYWADGRSIPSLVQACVRRMQALHEDWSVRAVTAATLYRPQLSAATLLRRRTAEHDALGIDT